MAAPFRRVASMLCNATAILLTLLSVAIGGDSFYRYFTVDSNVLVALTCLPVLVWQISTAKNPTQTLPMWMRVLKGVGSAGVTVTFLTVVFFLGPTQGLDIMFSGTALYMHLITPLCTLLSFLFLETEGDVLPRVYGWLLALPVYVYGILYLYMVLVSQSWPDFYGFNMGGKWYISLPVMYSLSTLLGFAMIAVHNLFARKNTIGEESGS